MDFDTVVMKFGGSSVADPDKIRHVARRLVDAKQRGLRVVGTVSAMGKTTDGLIDLAHQVSPTPNVREFDMTWLGIPIEKYGFSNDAMPYLTEPDFSRTKFRIVPGMNNITIHLQ